MRLPAPEPPRRVPWLLGLQHHATPFTQCTSPVGKIKIEIGPILSVWVSLASLHNGCKMSEWNHEKELLQF